MLIPENRSTMRQTKIGIVLSVTALSVDCKYPIAKGHLICPHKI